jgi:dTDP-glucose 4,6-dehydratase
VIARAVPAFGTHQHPARFLARAVTHLLDGRPVLLSGDGGRICDWLHVDDLCRGITLALLSGRPGEIYHLGGSVELSDRDLVGLLLDECGAGWDRVVAVAGPPGHDRRLALDDDKIREELGWRPHVEFDPAVAGVVRWYRANRDWWRPMVDDS